MASQQAHFRAGVTPGYQRWQDLDSVEWHRRRHRGGTCGTRRPQTRYCARLSHTTVAAVYGIRRELRRSIAHTSKPWERGHPGHFRMGQNALASRVVQARTYDVEEGQEVRM